MQGSRFKVQGLDSSVWAGFLGFFTLSKIVLGPTPAHGGRIGKAGARGGGGGAGGEGGRGGRGGRGGSRAGQGGQRGVGGGQGRGGRLRGVPWAHHLASYYVGSNFASYLNESWDHEMICL